MKFIPQKDQMDCGPACLAMVADAFGKKYPLDYLREQSYLTKEGVSLLGISEAAKKIGLDTYATKQTIDSLLEKKPQLVILHWNQNHFVILKEIKKSLWKKRLLFHIVDPAHGLIKLSLEDFTKSWLSDTEEGIILYLSPGESFQSKEPPENPRISVGYLLSYLSPHKRRLGLMFSFLLLGSLLTLIFPFLTQHLIDNGVTKKDIGLITLILLAQLVLFLGTIAIEIIRNWLVLYVGTKLSITIISDFLKRVLKLPIKFFDTKMMGDFQQRIQDNERIETFLTSESTTTFFSFLTFLVFFGVLWYYDVIILSVYLLLTLVSIFWSNYWLKKREYLDYFKFQQKSHNQNSIYEILGGVTELKLNQFEEYKRKEWEAIQEKLFKTNIRILKIDQLQLSGFQFLNQAKNILVTFMAARYVVLNSMTLGELLSVSYIIGAMNSPVNQLITFFRSFQYAKLSLERLNEVHNQEEEDQDSSLNISYDKSDLTPDNHRTIKVLDINFQYEGPKSPYILKDINLVLPQGKTTALVGASGSGKTTLMKLLLKFYEPIKGKILVGNDDLKYISSYSWRENVGTVMQDGYIFSDTIERNIAMGDEIIDEKRLDYALKISNIKKFVDSLPLGLETKIGATGNGISGGQKQRILIARAVYKNPHYVFLDEATSALDAENEKIIHDNLTNFFKNKTVLIIAHRLSTVKNADQIIVLNNGKIVEIGNHVQLVKNKANYFNLVKNQLELGT